MAASTRAQRRSLAFAVLTGPIAWTVYFLAGYSLTEAACRLPLLMGWVGGAGLSAVSVGVLVLTVAALLVILYAGWLAYGHWRRPAPAKSEMERFMAVSGLLLNALFGLLTIATGLPALVLAPCG
jgi:hypothetical protein